MADNLDAEFAAYQATQTGFASAPEPEPAPAPEEQGQEGEQEAAAAGAAEQEAPQAAEAQAPADEDEDGLDPSQPVPLAVLKKERQRRQEEARQRHELQRQLDIANERMSTIRALWENARKTETQEQPPAAQQATAVDDPEPNPDEDVFGHVKWQARQREREAKAAEERHNALQQQIARMEQASQQQAVTAQIHHVVTTAEAEFAAKTPDYTQALDYLRNVRFNQLRMHMPDDQARAQVGQEALALAQNALRRNANPAEFAYQYAMATGYRPPVAPKAGAAAPATTKTGEQPRGADGKFTPVASETIATANRAAAANKSLSGAPGGASGGAMTPDMLTKMAPAEFNAFYAKNAAAVDKILSGG